MTSKPIVLALLCPGLAAAAIAAGCAGGPTAPAPLTTVAALPTLAAAPNDLARIDASPMESYSRIAQGALKCWFGPTGALKGTHIFHADADPETEARIGSAEIALMERETALPKPWGRKVMRIVLAPADGKTAIAIENLKLPDPLFHQMKADIYAWATEKPSCTAGENGTGFYKPPPPKPPVKRAQAKKR